jgi:hypothetical protein
MGMQSRIFSTQTTLLFYLSAVGIASWKHYILLFVAGTSIPLNMDKSFTVNCCLEGLTEEKENFRYLGFTLHPTKGLINDFDLDIQKAKARLDRIPRKTPLFTKLVLLKSYVLSFFWFKAFLLTPDIPKVHLLIKDFLWKNKRVVVSNVRSSQPVCFGGLGIKSFMKRFTAFKVNLFERIRTCTEMKLHHMLKDMFLYPWVNNFIEGNHNLNFSPTLQYVHQCCKFC